MTAPGPAERRGTGQSRGRRGDRVHDHWGVSKREARRPASRSQTRGLRRDCDWGCRASVWHEGVSRAPLGVFSPGSVTTVLKGGHLRLPALPPRNRGAADAPRGGRVGRGMAAGAGGSRCELPRRLGVGPLRKGLGRRVPHVATGLRKGCCSFLIEGSTENEKASNQAFLFGGGDRCLSERTDGGKVGSPNYEPERLH